MENLVPSYQNAPLHNMNCFPRKLHNSYAYYIAGKDRPDIGVLQRMPSFNPQAVHVGFTVN